MQPLGGMRRDPAPSRIAYRLHRLWLTPLFRAVLRVGLPAFTIVFAVGVFLGDEARRSAITETMDEMGRQIRERPEFMVTGLTVSGASEPLNAAIRTSLDVTLPINSFALDLEALRRSVEALDPVARAEVRLRTSGMLEVRVNERVPVALWRSADGLALIDAGGVRAGWAAARADHPDMPLIAGEDADRHVAEALTLISAAEPLIDRVRGLVRIGARRWDLVLDRDQRILLPETGALRALERTVAMHLAQDLLDRDVGVVDLRLEHRPTLRMAPDALAEWHRVRGLAVAQGVDRR
jgi:cell division protein FtsQ